MARGVRRAILIGAGHNGLVCAFALARAGWQVDVFEARDIPGGACVTEEFHPGFRNSTAAYTVSLLAPEVIEAMRLRERGLRIVPRPEANFLPTEDGRSLLAGTRTREEVARFSAADADILPGFLDRLARVAAAVGRLARTIPPPGLARTADVVRGLWQLRRLLLPDPADRALLVDLLTRSVAAILRAHFASEPLKAWLAFDSIVGTWASPEEAGTGLVLLHHAWGEATGMRGRWGHAVGGMGAITQAMAAACRDAGVRVHLGCPVARVEVAGGRVRGVTLADGRAVSAPVVVAGVGPKLLFGRLMDPRDVPPEVARAMASFRTGSASLRMNVALSGLPRFTARPEPGPHLASGIVLGPSLDWMDRAFHESRLLGWSSAPVVEMLIPSLLDPTLAPPGAHVASLFAQHFAPTLPSGVAWDDARDHAAASVLDVVERFAPGFRKSVLGVQVLTPADLEARFGLVDGDIFHGRMTLEQSWALRPFQGAAAHRLPVPGLWLCGAGAHPGGGVSGLPGWNAARAILRAHR